MAELIHRMWTQYSNPFPCDTMNDSSIRFMQLKCQTIENYPEEDCTSNK